MQQLRSKIRLRRNAAHPPVAGSSLRYDKVSKDNGDIPRMNHPVNPLFGTVRPGKHDGYIGIDSRVP